MSNWQERVLPLAGVAQAAAAVQQYAREGALRDPQSGKVLFQSVLELTPASTEATYGDRTQLALGLRVLLQQIGSSQAKDVEITRYAVGIIALADRLLKNQKRLAELGARLQHVERQKNEFGFAEDTITASLAGIYSDLISPLLRPLKINGEPTHLQQKTVQNNIRAALLGGVRSAVLWRQNGGQRRNFIFSRQRMVSAAKELLQARTTPPENLS